MLLCFTCTVYNSQNVYCTSVNECFMFHVSWTFSTVNQIKMRDTNVQNDIKCGKWSHGNGMQVERSKCNICHPLFVICIYVVYI